MRSTTAGVPKTSWVGFLPLHSAFCVLHSQLVRDVLATDDVLPHHSKRAGVSSSAPHGTIDAALGSLTPDDLAGHVVIRGEVIALPRALTRNLSHVAGHVHQLVLLAKHWTGSSWKTLSIPRGMSEQARLGGTSGASGPRV